jgi:hypothetical protein
MPKESFAPLLRFVTYLVKQMKFLALVEWMLMDAKSPMNAIPLEEMSKETYVRPIVQGNVMRTKKCFVQAKQRKMVAKNLTYALLEEKNRVVLRSEKNATVTAQINVRQMKSNANLRWILVIAVQLRRFVDQLQRIFMVYFVMPIRRRITALSFVMSKIMRCYALVMRTRLAAKAHLSV